MNLEQFNLVAIVGTTASGKTRLGVQLARRYGGEIISADSRQVYRGLDLGSGKDLVEYRTGGAPVPYHLVDRIDLSDEYNVFAFQRDFFRTFETLIARGVLPVVVGGSGLYLEAVLSNYRMVEVPVDDAWRVEAETMGGEELEARLRETKGALHNTTDLTDRSRTIRAIEIAEYSAQHDPQAAPEIRPLLIGVRWDKDTLHQRIRDRLVERIDEGLIQEVEGLLQRGVPREKLDFLGLEFRYVLNFLEGDIRNKNDLIQKLSAAIVTFSRKQAKWFRRMERRGVAIHWIEGPDTDAAFEIMSRAFPTAISD